MHFSGKAHKVGANIDTDAIIPARYLVSTEPEVLGTHCMAGLEPDWVQRVQAGDILVGGPNFGCGSSREHAPLAILGAGIPVVVAHSFARIFYRNAFNMGLVLMEVGEDVALIQDGDSLDIDVQEGRIRNLRTQQVITVPPLPEFMQTLLAAGGLVEYVRDRLARDAVTA
ncbi:3-isopropylmalate dehydratase small subunit [Desulfovermiculus halophilus]|uniref:3-isopropylmalate dehydratase small subunit n=1 Tax=Desulfovermiculus halophilus TaxID=339722 RepID=UPI00047FD554|nr:3-isopropylmalate dehydratase small subunit [Desulfovermiculus halophilus]